MRGRWLPTPRPTVGLGVCSAAPSYTEELCAAINGECYPSRAACTADGGCDFYAEGCGDGECGCCIPALLCGGSPPAPTLETPIAETSALETAPEVPVPEGDGVQRSGATTPPVALMGLVLAGSAVAACVVCALRWRAKTRSLSKTTMRQPGWVEDTVATVQSTGANPMQMTEQREIEMAENPGSTVQSTSANPMQMTEQHEVM